MPMPAANEPQSVSAALRVLIARADALPAGEAERHVRLCAHALTTACVRRTGVDSAIDRLARSLTELQTALSAGTRRRHQHDAPAMQRLTDTLRDDLLPLLRRGNLLST
jgi:hypothetical protein